ncbi:hypothetical protein Sjap_019233 [Stephania japonica]|uniref:Pentatricopeptide repeat-containing protein n=1 Tax=Stephania japonica TaxID=461633 RepID=A0AAP0F7A1_9MAGN
MLNRQHIFQTIDRATKRLCQGFKDYHCQQHAFHPFGETPQPKPISIHHSMLSSLRRERPYEALETFRKQILQSGVSSIDEVIVAIGLKACRGDVKLGCQIHGLAVFSGLDSFLTVSNSLMSLYCKAGLFEQAFGIFENLSSPDIVSSNTILSGFQCPKKGVEFAIQMHQAGVAFDAVTYTTALAFCSSVDELNILGIQLHALIFKHGLDADTFVGNALVTMYGRWVRLSEAERVFSEIPDKDLISWNSMLSGYTQEGNCGLEAIRVFVEMVREGLKLDHVSFASVVAACGHEKNLNFGRQLHSLILRTGCSTYVSVCNVLMSMYSKCEAVSEAKEVFDSMIERNVISWTTMISIDEEKALSHFSEMRLDGVPPNEVTFVGMIHAISMKNTVKEGQTIHGQCTKVGFSFKQPVSNILITMYAKFGYVEDSMKVFSEISFRELISCNALISGYVQNNMFQEALQAFQTTMLETKPNEFTFGSVLSAIGAAEPIPLSHGQRCHSRIIKLGLETNLIVSGALVDMYAKRGSIEDSRKMFEEIPQKTLVAWTSIISAFARHDDFKSVMDLFENMEVDGIQPDSITFLAILTACSRKGMVDMGLRVFNSMVRNNQIEPSQEHYSCVIDMLGRAGRLKEVEEFIHQMPIKPGISALQSLLGACKMYGNVEMGRRTAEALMELEPTESGSYVVMSNLYAERGEWDKVARIRKGMRDKGLKKEVGFSWVDVNDSMLMHGFSSYDKSHPQTKNIYRTVEFLAAEMRFLEIHGSERDVEDDIALAM